jgi:hypothetical protein
LKLKYICGDERLEARIHKKKASLTIHFVGSGNGSPNGNNKELQKAISYSLELACKRNDVVGSIPELEEIKLRIHHLLCSGKANVFTIPIKPNVIPSEIRASFE